MTKSITARQILGTAAVMALGAVCFAVFTQYALDMQPCPWCVLQRLICIAIVLSALPGVLWAQRSTQILGSLLVVIFALAGAAAALWQHFVAAASASCDLTLADRIISGMLSTMRPWPGISLLKDSLQPPSRIPTRTTTG